MSYNSTTELDIGPAKEGLSALFGVILSPEPCVYANTVAQIQFKQHHHPCMSYAPLII